MYHKQSWCIFFMIYILVATDANNMVEKIALQFYFVLHNLFLQYWDANCDCPIAIKLVSQLYILHNYESLSKIVQNPFFCIQPNLFAVSLYPGESNVIKWTLKCIREDTKKGGIWFSIADSTSQSNKLRLWNVSYFLVASVALLSKYSIWYLNCCNSYFIYIPCVLRIKIVMWQNLFQICVKEEKH